MAFNFGHMGLLGQRRVEETFDQTYQCYSVSFLQGKSREFIAKIENGGKIIMPPSALDILSRMNVMFPMLFSLYNSKTKRKTHCGVLEFVADHSRIYLPHWMMQNLLLSDGDRVRVANLTLPACSFAKVKPASVDFLEISNPKGALNYACTAPRTGEQ